MKNPVFSVAAWLLFGFVMTGVSLGQAGSTIATGAQKFGSLGGGPFDLVNLGNLNVHFDVPVIQKAGRGSPYTFTLSYDNSIWYPVTSSGSQTWGVANLGWNFIPTPTTVGRVTSQTITSWTQPCNPPSNMTPVYVELYGNFVYYDSQGGTHPFSFQTSNYTLGSSCSISTNPNSNSGTATDGSGLTLYMTATTAQKVLGANGWIVYEPSGSTSITIDANGNEVTTSGGVVADTLGDAALTITGTNPYYLQYAAPNGGTAQYTLNYGSYDIKTNFGCSTVTDTHLSGLLLLNSIVLPDGTSYQFGYEATMGSSGSTTGRIASVTLPTGGTISYAYSGGVNDSLYNAILCTDGTTPVLTRTLTPGGQWTYSHQNTSGQWTTTVTSPPDPVNSGSASDVTVINFAEDANTGPIVKDFYETQRKAYQGSATGTPLFTQTTCYNHNYASCSSASVSSPITQTDRYTQYGSGNTRLSEVTYDSTYGLTTGEKDYNYGVSLGSAPSSTYLMRSVTIQYGSYSGTCTTSVSYIPGLPCLIATYNSSGTLVSKSILSYDETGLTYLSGTPQHTTVSGPRGNLTTLGVQTKAAGAMLYRRFTYDDTGLVNTATDWGTTTAGGANVTGYNYAPGPPSPSCGNSFVTSLTEPLSLTRSFTWDCNGGVLTSVTDENLQTTSTYYTGSNFGMSADPDFWRPYATADQLGNATTLSYPTNKVTESALLFNGGNSVVDQRLKADNLGRLILNQIKEGPSSTSYDSTETIFDTFGRVSETLLPFTNTADSTCSSGCKGVTTTYDALGRAFTVTNSGSGTVTDTYTSNDVLQVIGPAPSGENTKQKQLEYDGLGRLSSVCEITSTTGSGTCAQTNSQTGYWTKYAYDGLGDVIGVTQNAQAASGSQQTRAYVYDMIGRLTSEQNPETGSSAISYIYDVADSSCSSYSSPGDVVEKKDAMGNVTCMKYDALHRVVQTTYPSGSYATVTPTKCYVYDSATVNSLTMANAKTRLAEAYTTAASSCPGTVSVDEGFSYSARGEVADVWEKTPDSGGYYHVNATYWAHGRLNVLNGGTAPLPGLPAITYGASTGSGLDGKGRITSVTAASGQNPVNSISWNAGNQVTGVTFGSLDSDAYQYDPNTGRMMQYQFNMGTGPTSETGVLTWNANATARKLILTDQINTANSQTCTYGYDDLIRTTSANCGSVWSQTFSFDPFGNLSKSGSAAFAPTYTGTSGTGTTPTNQYYQIPSGATGTSNYYDSNGNLKNDITNTYTWDADGNMLSANGSTVTIIYDALDRMIEQTRGSAHTEIVYGPYGLKLALMNGQTLVNAFVKMPGGSRAVYNGSGIAYYRHGDHLGSSRLATTPSRTKYYDVAYAPYGENYNGSGTTPDLAFTDQNQDTLGGGSSSNLYDFMLREYRPAHGRWTSPDPAGLGVVDPTNPQTWNRYAYVLNNPMAMIDLLGDDGCYDNNGFYWANVQAAQCSANDWNWFPTTFYSTQGNPINLGVTMTGGGWAYTSPNGTVLSPQDLAEYGAWALPGNGCTYGGLYQSCTPPTVANQGSGCPPGANCTAQGGAPTNNGQNAPPGVGKPPNLILRAQTNGSCTDAVGEFGLGAGTTAIEGGAVVLLLATDTEFLAGIEGLANGTHIAAALAIGPTVMGHGAIQTMQNCFGW